MAAVSFGEWLKRQRKARGLTQKQLALHISCSTSALKKLEAEQRRPSAQIVERLADFFTIPASERTAFLRFARGDWEAAPNPPPGDAPWRTPRPVPANNLPIPLTTFVGRKQELADALRLLARHRLLTLTGPGGVGKTRLAIQASTKLLARFADGVWWVELAPLTDENLIPQAVASALEVREVPGQSLNDVIAQFLRSRQLLLVLDNCEHLIAGCARLAYDLLTHCAGLKILATSREALDVSGETPYQVPALSLPRPEQLTLADLLLEYEGIRLFVERARQKSGFRLAEANAAAVLQICRHLDGIPLALELAAARTSLLTAEQIAERLADRFNLLTHGSRAALPRQQTLRATLDWSHNLLTEHERALFRRLAVFAGGWTLEAARAVCASDGVETEAVLDLLAELAQKSLVRLQAGEGETRYQMLETIGEYAREKLAEAGETERISVRHRDWFLQVAASWQQPERETSARQPLDWIAHEHDNFRAALDWSLRAAQVAQALRLANFLISFWTIRAAWSEGRAWIERALSIAHFDARTATPQEASLRAQALCLLGMLAISQRDFAAAQGALVESLGLYRRLVSTQGLNFDEKMTMGLGLNYLAFTVYFQGDYDRAKALHEEALALYRALDVLVGSSFTLTMLGRVAICQGQYDQAAQLGEESAAIGRRLNHVHLLSAALDVTGRARCFGGDFQRALPLLEESLTLSKELDFQQDVVDVLNFLGLVEFYQGHHGQALARLDEALRLSQTIAYSMGRACALTTQAQVALAESSLARARPLLAESLALLRQLGLKWYLVRGLEIQAASEAAEHRPARAARLFGAAAAAREALGAPLPPPDQPAYERAVALARAPLEPEVFTAAWNAGQALTLEQASAYALDGPDS